MSRSNPTQPITGESSSGDIAANGFWEAALRKRTLDVRVFNLHAPSN